MKTIISPEINELMETIHYRPAVSIIMPFEPKMSAKSALAHSLQAATDKVEKELLENYPDEVSILVMQKLRDIIRSLNYSTHKRSIAIYVSPVFERVIYLDMLVEERITVDDSFEIRDLVLCRKQAHKYLVLLLNGKESRIYLADEDCFTRIVSTTPESVYAYINEVPEKVANFSDLAGRREKTMHKFLHYIDNGLAIILNAYQLPLFVLGPERMVGHFKNITKHNTSIIDYVYGSYQDATEKDLQEILGPHVADWKGMKQKELFNKIEEAAGKKKLAVGIRDVWRRAVNHNGRLLILEKDYLYAAEHGSSDDIIYKAIKPYNKFSTIKDAVDDVIEKVLENGGEVEFVERDVLKDYQHIAMLQYY